MEGNVLHDFPVSRRWRAKWIWHPGEPEVPNSFYLEQCKSPLAKRDSRLLAVVGDGLVGALYVYWGSALDSRVLSYSAGERMVARGATSVFEEWGLNGSWRSGDFQPIMRTLSHAWSAYPAEFLIRHLIGLQILEPGCRRVYVHPQETDFDYAVAFPTPRGLIEVRKQGQEISVTIPEDIQVLL